MNTVATADVVEELIDARQRTLALVESLSDADVECVHSELMSPLAWDLGHIAAFEDLWLRHRMADQPLLRPGLAEIYDAFETPRAHRGELDFLSRAGCLEYLQEVRADVLDDVAQNGLRDEFLFELVLRHELQHAETMLQTLELASIEGYQPPAWVGLPLETTDLSGLETVEIAAGEFELGADEDGFAYDNERSVHTVELPSFRIGTTPVTSAAFSQFIEDDGYQRREWWSEQGWAWRQTERVSAPRNWLGDGQSRTILGTQPTDPGEPVAHVSWFEADAFAHSRGMRLPTEAEWEKAVRSDRSDLQMIGTLWEWTASNFTAYPGFKPYPYKEYSEVFFGADYKVLRGGSWATARRVATPTFRNWDYPQRRQIFSGFRVCE